MELQHWGHWQHPLVFNEDERSGRPCYGCREPVFGPSYSCKECRGEYVYHKSCAELPIGLFHPSHPNHPLILFDPYTYRDNNRGEYDKFSNCDVCKEKNHEYNYCCYRCNFNIHIRCSSLSLTIQTEVHDHQLTRSIWKLMKFTCDFCGKKGNLPYCCVQCDFAIHSRCAACPRRLKVFRHNHPLHLTPSLEVHQSHSPICRLCVRKVDTLWLYYCSSCDFATHLYCAMLSWNWEHINFQELEDEQSTESKVEFPEFFDTEICKVIKTTMGEDGTEIVTEIKHFSHQHDLKLTNEIPKNKKCNGCVQYILPPFYSCTRCSFFLHKSCSKLPKIKQHPLHYHPLTLNYQQASFYCTACGQSCNGFKYNCQTCKRNYNIQCILLLDTLTHACHEHRLYLSKTNFKQKCSSCNFERRNVFRCSTCEFVLDFNCATLPQTTWYNQHEHPFTLCYNPEDDSGEYYCEICEEERDPKQWFYYCAECSFPTHRDCILGKNPKVKQHI